MLYKYFHAEREFSVFAQNKNKDLTNNTFALSSRKAKVDLRMGLYILIRFQIALLYQKH